MGVFTVIVIIIGVVLLIRYTAIKNLFSSYYEQNEKIEIDLEFPKSTINKGHYLIFDTETTGLPKFKNGTPDGSTDFPNVVQLAWILFDQDGGEIENKSFIIKQNEVIPESAVRVHGIDNRKANEWGKDAKFVYDEFSLAIKNSKCIVAHNIDFDWRITESDMIKNGFSRLLVGKKKICTMEIGTYFCKIDSNYGKGYKWPTLEELYYYCFKINVKYDTNLPLHNARIDVALTAKCFFYFKNLGVIKY